MSPPDFGGLSLWHATCGDDLTPRPSLDSAANAERDVDVAIVGAGYTGLWTAYYLKHADPSVRVAIVESQIAGFGASGRNGGWCSSLYPTSLRTLARLHGRAQAVRQYRALQASVAEVGRVIETESFDADWQFGGTITLVRNAAQVARARDEVTEAREFGFDESDLELLDADDARSHLQATDILAGVHNRHCAVVHPAKLVRSLARAAERLGVTIYERTPAMSLAPGTVRTEYGTLHAEFVIRATEAFTVCLPGHERDLAPVYSLMIATEPLPDSVWESIGLSQRETFADLRHLIVYGQRTADGRLAFGGRGAPYHWGSRIRPSFDRDPAVFDRLRRDLAEFLPPVAEAGITHHWGGPVAIARDWQPSVGLDRASGIGWAGGYVGDGVATSNLAGRTLADLVLGRDSDLVSLPWVSHRSPTWPREPLRWIGSNLALRTMSAADRTERRTGRPSRLAPAVNRVLSR